MSIARLVASMKAAGCTAEQIGAAVITYSDGGGRSPAAERQVRYRERRKEAAAKPDGSVTRDVTRDGDITRDVTVTHNGDVTRDASEPALARAFSMGEDIRSTLEADASKGADAPSEEAKPETFFPEEKTLTPDALLYARAREIAGSKSGQFVTILKRQNGGDVGDTRQMIEQAALADDPLQYLIGMAARGKRRANFAQSRPPPSPDAPYSPRTQILMDIASGKPSLDDPNENPPTACADASGGRGGPVLWVVGS